MNKKYISLNNNNLNIYHIAKNINKNKDSFDQIIAHIKENPYFYLEKQIIT